MKSAAAREASQTTFSQFYADPTLNNCMEKKNVLKTFSRAEI